MTDHDRIEELMTLEALDALEEADAEELARALEEQGPECGECARLRREIGDVAGRLAFALDPVPVGEDIRDQILLERPPLPRRRIGGLRGALIAAAAAVLVVLGAVGGYLLAPRQQPDVAALAEFLARPDVRVLRFEGPGGNLAAAVTPREGFLFGSELPPVPDERVYELWMIRGETPVRGVCVAPRDGVVVARFEGAITASDVLAVTVESESCPSAPTTDPIFVAPLEV